MALNDTNEDVRMDSILAKLGDDDGATPAKPEEAAVETKPEKEETPATEKTATGEEPAVTGAAATPPTETNEGNGEPARPAIEPPKFIKAEYRDKWNTLPTEWQRYLVSQEEENSKTVSTKLEEAASIRRTAEAAQRVAEERASSVAQEQQRYAQTLATLAQQMELLDPVLAQYRRTDLVKLANENPAEYAKLDAAYRQRIEALNAIQSEQARVQVQAMQTHFQREEKELLQKWPDLSKPEIGEKTLNDMRSGVVANYGFRPEEVRVISDHRYVLMARDALEARNLREEVAKLKTHIADKEKAARDSIQEKRVTPQKPVLKPGPSEETREAVNKDRNKAILKQARGARSLSDKASLIADML